MISTHFADLPRGDSGLDARDTLPRVRHQNDHSLALFRVLLSFVVLRRSVVLKPHELRPRAAGARVQVHAELLADDP